MNLLINQPPETVEIDGKEVKLNTDFRYSLRILLAFEDWNLTDQEKIYILLENLYPEWPDDTVRAAELGMKFLNLGNEPDEVEQEDLRLFSFEKDSNLIFAAFKQTHGIDLERENLHWWKFMALFMDLGSDTAFCQLIAFRKRVKSGTATKEELREYRENKDYYDLPEPDTRTPEEKFAEEQFMRLLKSEI